jgi:hypothetical protein
VGATWRRATWRGAVVTAIARGEGGRFLKGAASPNASGRPKLPAELREEILRITPQAIRLLEVQVERALQPKSSTSDRQLGLQAAQQLLDRGLGKPIEQHLVAQLHASTEAPGAFPGCVFLPVQRDPLLDAPWLALPAPIDAEIVAVGAPVDANCENASQEIEIINPVSGPNIPSVGKTWDRALADLPTHWKGTP